MFQRVPMGSYDNILPPFRAYLIKNCSYNPPNQETDHVWRIKDISQGVRELTTTEECEVREK